jgi:FtsP/CotA-like multicopper oxidase with cupredoxin domain
MEIPVKTKDAGLVTATLAILLTLCLGAATLLADEAIHTAPVTATVAKTRPGYKPAELPVLSSGHIVPIKLALIDKTVDIGGGRKYEAWSFNGTVPGPVLHARVGDTLDVELTNTATMGHSIDFHAELGPNQVAYQTIAPARRCISKFPPTIPACSSTIAAASRCCCISPTACMAP